MYKDKELEDNILKINTLLKAKDVAEILNLSRSKTYHLMQIGEIPTVRIGKSRRVRPEDLIKYIESNTYTVNPYFEQETILPTNLFFNNGGVNPT